MAQQNNNMANGNGKRRMKVIGALALIVVVGMAVVWLKVVRAGDDPASQYATFVVKRGPLTISVLETGTIKAREQEIIKNELEGRTSIIRLIDEGTRVKAGELLVELDSSNLVDARIEQDIRVRNAEASWINADKNFAVVENQAKSDTEKAELTLRFAEQDLKLYLEGKYLNDKTAAENKVQEAQEVLTRAEEVLKWSQTLYDEKYISETELKADQLSVTRYTNALTVARNDLRLLEEFTKQRNIDQYESDVSQANLLLQRTKDKAAANIAQASADRDAKQLELKRQKEKLAKIEDQLNKTKVYAPKDGMVIYATTARGGGFRDNRQPLDEGVEVFERQELIYLPTAASSTAEVDIHEASLEKVRIGLPAVITVDALPGKKFIGMMNKIAPLPDPQSMWMNPDLKVYNSEIYLEGDDPGLRTGMSCKAEVIVEQHTDAMYVPVQAVLRVEGRPTVFVLTPARTVEQRAVEVGLDNMVMIRIISGLEEGEEVLLEPPLESATADASSKGIDFKTSELGTASDEMKEQIDLKLQRANEPATTAPAQPGQEGQEGPGAGQMGEMMRRFQNMTPEEQQKERERMKQRLESMTPEERERMKQRFQGQGGGPGQGQRSGGEGRAPGQRRAPGAGRPPGSGPGPGAGRGAMQGRPRGNPQ